MLTRLSKTIWSDSTAMIPDYILRIADARQREECRDLWRRVYSHVAGGVVHDFTSPACAQDVDLFAAAIADQAVKRYKKIFYVDRDG